MKTTSNDHLPHANSGWNIISAPISTSFMHFPIKMEPLSEVERSIRTSKKINSIMGKNKSTLP
jgi:hypothetical protein